MKDNFAKSIEIDNAVRKLNSLNSLSVNFRRSFKITQPNSWVEQDAADRASHPKLWAAFQQSVRVAGLREAG